MIDHSDFNRAMAKWAIVGAVVLLVLCGAALCFRYEPLPYLVSGNVAVWDRLADRVCIIYGPTFKRPGIACTQDEIQTLADAQLEPSAAEMAIVTAELDRVMAAAPVEKQAELLPNVVAARKQGFTWDEIRQALTEQFREAKP